MLTLSPTTRADLLRSARTYRLDDYGCESLLAALADESLRSTSAPVTQGRPRLPVSETPQECCAARPFSGGWCRPCYRRRRERYLERLTTEESTPKSETNSNTPVSLVSNQPRTKIAPSSAVNTTRSLTHEAERSLDGYE